jgi:hypothetical protein
MAEMAIEPRQPSRLEKRKNKARSRVYLAGNAEQMLWCLGARVDITMFLRPALLG